MKLLSIRPVLSSQSYLYNPSQPLSQLIREQRRKRSRSTAVSFSQTQKDMRRLILSSSTRIRNSTRRRCVQNNDWLLDSISQSSRSFKSVRAGECNTRNSGKVSTNSVKTLISTNDKLRSSNETTVDNPNPLKRETFAVKLDPRAIFPWRHTPHPLPRLIPGMEEFETQGGYLGPNLPPLNKFFRGLTWVNSAGFLGAKIFNYGQWKEDLEYAFLHAFSVGVQGVLNDVYHLPQHQQQQQQQDHEQGLKLDSDEALEDADGGPSASTKEDSLTGSSTDNGNDSEIFPIEFTHTITPEDEYQLKHASEEVACNHMLEPTLISLYRSAHTYCKHKLEIKLRSKPKSAQIQSLFLVPFLTRAEVEDNVTLKHSFRNVVKALHRESEELGRELSYFEIGSIVAEELDDMSENQMMRRQKAGEDDNVVQMTVVSQVSIQCDELFVVRDTDTGDVVQGDPKENLNEVTHLVRFETVIALNMETRETVIVGWQITDWDDLLDGNIWFS